VFVFTKVVFTLTHSASQSVPIKVIVVSLDNFSNFLFWDDKGLCFLFLFKLLSCSFDTDKVDNDFFDQENTQNSDSVPVNVNDRFSLVPSDPIREHHVALCRVGVHFDLGDNSSCGRRHHIKRQASVLACLSWKGRLDVDQVADEKIQDPIHCHPHFPNQVGFLEDISFFAAAVHNHEQQEF